MDDLEAAIDRLYQIPLVEFTPARNALAAERKALGDKVGSLRVKALAKPSAVAWAVNQVYWQEPSRFQALADALVGVAAAQKEGLSGGSGAALREAMRRKSESLADLARRAERRLVEAGSASSPAVLQRLTATIETLASPRSGQREPPRPGRLTAELQSAGFDLALGLQAMDLPPAPTPRMPTTDEWPSAPPENETAPEATEDASAQEAMAREKARAQEIESRRRRATAEVAQARREMEAATTTLGEAEARLAAARADVATLAKRLEEAQTRVTRQQGAENDARQRLSAARSALVAAEAALQRVGDGSS